MNRATSREIEPAQSGHAYLVRYGTMGVVGRFLARGHQHERDDRVVVRTQSGTELGEVLAADWTSAPRDSQADLGVIVRPATPDDIAAAERHERQRRELFAACEQLAAAEGWPIVLLDVEMVLAPLRVVLHYLSARAFEVGRLPLLEFAGHRLEVYFNPTGREPALADDDEPEVQDDGTGACASCGAAAGQAGQRCGTGGCSGCALAAAAHRSVPAAH